MCDMDRFEDSQLSEELYACEALLMQGENERACTSLHVLADEAESYASANYVTSETDQWFSFNNLFERLCYQRLENDPRTLHNCPDPLSRLYADLARAYICVNEIGLAKEALKAAIRWNPMDCASRLNLSDVMLHEGDTCEYLALSYSVLERASTPDQLARAYLNFIPSFRDDKKNDAVHALVHVLKQLDSQNSEVQAIIHEAQGSEFDADSMTSSEAREILTREGLPCGANVDVCICLLTASEVERSHNHPHEATRLILRAHQLLGKEMAMKLLQEIQEANKEAGVRHG